MAINVLQAAKHLCKESDWELTNLEVQKILYIVHMFYLGKTDKPLLKGHFEAWNYGPVNPTLYYKLKRFGSSSIDSDTFIQVQDLDKDVYKEEIKILTEASKKFPHPSGPKLIEITHHKIGAWKKLYKSGEKGIIIEKNDIIEEYKERQKRQQEREQENTSSTS